MTDLTRLAHDLFHVLERTDPELAARTVHPAFSNREAGNSPAPASLPGPRGVLASSAWMRAAFADLHFRFLETVTGTGQDGGDQVWLRLRMQGRHTGPFVQFAGGEPQQVLPPTGGSLDTEQIHVLQVRDGMVLRHEAVRDDVAMLGQLGAFPPSPQGMARMLVWRLSGRAARAARTVDAASAAAASRAVADGATAANSGR